MSDWYQIESNHLIVQVVNKGAEIKRLFNKIWNKELLWSGDEKVWNRSAPILFPIIGELKDGEYTFNDKTYQLPRHGFARDLDFICTKCTGEEVEFTLMASKETYKIYPFIFEFKVRYYLEEFELKITYSIKNLDSKEMYFSLGFHPGFDLDLNGQYEIHFEKVENEFIGLTNNLLDRSKIQPFKSNKLVLDKNLFKNDALIIQNPKSTQIDLVDLKHKKVIRMKKLKCAYLGIWSKDNMPFICIEPWQGIADSVDHDKEFTKKAGIMKLATNKEYTSQLFYEFLG